MAPFCDSPEAILRLSWAFWGRLGAILGSSSAFLGPLGGHLGLPWGRPGLAWAILSQLGPFQGHLGSILEPFCTIQTILVCSVRVRCRAYAMEQAVDLLWVYYVCFVFLVFYVLLMRWTCMMLRATQTLSMKELNKKVCMDIHTGER